MPGFWIGLGISPSVLSLYQESSPEQKEIIIPQSTRFFIQPQQPEMCRSCLRPVKASFPCMKKMATWWALWPQQSPKKSSKKKSDSFFPHWDTNFAGFVPAPARLHVQHACKYSLHLLIFHLCFGRCCVNEKDVMLRVFWQVSVGQLSCSSACAAGDSVRFQSLLPVTQDYLPDTLESCHL